MVREFTYRGNTIEHLKEMSMDNFIQLLPSRQRRSLLKGLTDQQKLLLERIRKSRRGITEDKPIKTHCREMIIIPEMVGLTIMVYNGKEFIPIMIRPEMVGHFLGEFSLTCKRVTHGTPGIGASKSSMYVPLK